MLGTNKIHHRILLPSKLKNVVEKEKMLMTLVYSPFFVCGLCKHIH